MARTNMIDSASRQFFINVSDNDFLDFQGGSSCTREQESAVGSAKKGMFKPSNCKSYGYAVFGRVIDGMDVLIRSKLLVLAVEKECLMSN